MIKFLWQKLATIEYVIDKADKIEPFVKPYLDRLNNSFDAVKKQRVNDAIAEKVKQGWDRKGAEIAVLWENNIMTDAWQTEWQKGTERLRIGYAKLLCSRALALQQMTKILTADAFLSKKPFVDMVCAAGFTFVSRLQHNSYLRYAYTGEQKPGRGRRKEYGGKIDLRNLDEAHFTILKKEEHEIVYEGVAHVRSLKRWCKLVVVHVLRHCAVSKVVACFSTDKDMEGLVVYQCYKMRYQIEFLFRDAKTHLGLEHTQSRQKDALNFHFNINLSRLNVAKAAHWLNIPKNERGPFSMADIKTQYINELLLDRLISFYGKDPSVEKNKPEIKKLYQLGRIAA